MNDPKTINGQDAAVRYSLFSSIRAISEKFTTKPIVRMGRTAVSIRPTLRTFGSWQRLIFAYAIPVAGGLADRKLDDESSGTKDVKQLSEVPNVIADKVEPDEELRRKSCTGEPSPDKRRWY
jgi:hypothetical protein